jgi:hypothetical protein
VEHIDSQLFLVTVCNPLQTTLQVHIEWESQGVLGLVLQRQLELVQSKGLSPIFVYVDTQSALRTLPTKFENAAIDVGGAGECEQKVGAKIQRKKKQFRWVRGSLPCLPPIW